MKFTLVIICAFTSIVSVKSCTYLTAQDYSQTFDSHFFYGYSNYDPNENSCWIIEAPSDKVVYLDSQTFNLESTCSYDSVNVYDGNSYFSPLELTVCGNDGVNSYTSSGRYVYVTFVTDSSAEYEGFRMSYKSVDVTVNGCTYLYAQDFSRTFDSHESYGILNYGPNEYSCWIIEAPSDKLVYLDSESFSLESSCSYDSVKVHDGDSSSSPLALDVCGSEGVNSYTSSGRYVYVQFATDESGEYEGFRMSYERVDADNNDNNYSPYTYEDETTALTVGAIIGIVVGCLLGLALLIGIIVCVVVMVSSSNKRGAVHSTTTTGQTRVHTNQAFYPGQQTYVNPGYTGAFIVASSHQVGTQQAMGPVPAPQQQVPMASHPVDAKGVPLPAVYNAP